MAPPGALGLAAVGTMALAARADRQGAVRRRQDQGVSQGTVSPRFPGPTSRSTSAYVGEFFIREQGAGKKAKSAVATPE